MQLDFDTIIAAIPHLSIIQANEVVHASRKHVLNTGRFDLLDTQNYNTLRLVPIMSAVDDSFEVLLEKRGGADYHFCGPRGTTHEGEMKAANLSGRKLTTKLGWTFHALAVLDNGFEDYFLLYTHDAGMPVRIYDVRDPQKVRIINETITGLAAKWKAEVVAGTRSGKNDMICLKEAVVMPLFAGEPLFEYRNGAVAPSARTDIMQDQHAGVVSIYSDYLA